MGTKEAEINFSGESVYIQQSTDTGGKKSRNQVSFRSNVKFEVLNFLKLHRCKIFFVTVLLTLILLGITPTLLFKSVTSRLFSISLVEDCIFSLLFK